MLKGMRISLANKCQLLFGAAVVLIVTAGLMVASWRMERLVELVPRKRAADFATAWLADQIQLGGALTPVDNAVGPLPADEDLAMSVIDADDFARVAERDPFLAEALEHFQLRYRKDLFVAAKDEAGATYYRYVRGIYKRDLDALRGGAAAGFEPGVDSTGLANPLELMLLIHLRNQDTAKEQVINWLYLLTAGLVACLLAIAVFWFITTRIVLSPVRVLRDYAHRVSEGNLNIRSDINTGDEFEQLSDMFNTMLESLKSNEEQLRAVNKSLDLKLGELAESNVALFEANKMKGEFLANVSHELRTPLNSIIGFAEVLQETLADRTGPVDEKRKRYCTNIIGSSRRLLELINELLDLAKIEAGRMQLNVTSVSLVDTAEGLISLIRPQAEKAGVNLKLAIPPNLPVVETDAGRLQQIIFNFLANAVKFTPGGGDVTLSASREADSSQLIPPSVRISVSDTGPGIAYEDQDRIFEKFVQLDQTVTREQGGTGLGLTISRELAELLQGHIELESEPGQGATFSLVIPIEMEQAGEPLMPQSTSDPSV